MVDVASLNDVNERDATTQMAKRRQRLLARPVRRASPDVVVEAQRRLEQRQQRYRLNSQIRQGMQQAAARHFGAG